MNQELTQLVKLFYCKQKEYREYVCGCTSVRPNLYLLLRQDITHPIKLHKKKPNLRNSKCCKFKVSKTIAEGMSILCLLLLFVIRPFESTT